MNGMKQLFAVIAAWTLAVAVCAAEAPAVRYVVTLQVPPIEASATANDLVTRYGGKVVPLSAQNFVGVAVETTPDAAARMADDARVASIEAQFIGGNAAHAAGPVMLETAGVGVKGVAIPRPLQTPPRAASHRVETPVVTEAAPRVPAANPKTAPPHAASSQAPLHAIANGTGDWNSGTYSYDGAGNIYAIGSNYYVYDKASRLTEGTPAYESSVTSTYRQTFTYDQYGNMTAKRTYVSSQSDEELGLSAATNRLTSASYDVSGNVIALGGKNYAWDALNVLTGKGTDAQYLYDADDERIATISGGTTSYTLRGPDQKVLRELTHTVGSGTDVWQWKRDSVYRDDLLLAEVLTPAIGSDPVVRHFHLDHLGTPRIVTNDGGARTSTMVFWPFGEVLAATVVPGTDRGDGRDPLRYTGHEYDADPNGNDPYDLNYMHARYELGRKGRFLSVDPTLNLKRALREPQNWNRYSYVMNNPLRYTDPDGRDHYQEPGLTVPTSQWGTALAMDENTPAVVQGAFYAEGALLGMAAGGGAAVRAYQALQYASLVFATSFPALYNAAQSYLSDETGTPSLGGFRAAGSAIGKAETTAAQFGMTRDALVTSVVKNGARFVDQSHGTVNMFMKRPDGKSGFVRVTIDATGKILSVGLNTAANLKKGITKRRWIPF